MTTVAMKYKCYFEPKNVLGWETVYYVIVSERKINIKLNSRNSKIQIKKRSKINSMGKGIGKESEDRPSISEK